jgi:hypothetical protein
MNENDCYNPGLTVLIIMEFKNLYSHRDKKKHYLKGEKLARAEGHKLGGGKF